MPVAVYFHPASLDEHQYRAVLDQLVSDGAWPPPGLVHHSCFGEGNGLMVYEVWQDQDALDAFGQKLVPVLQQEGVEVGQPQVMPVVNTGP